MHNTFWRESQNALLKSEFHIYKNDGTPHSFQRAWAEIIDYPKEINTHTHTHTHAHTNIRTEKSEPLH